MIPTLDKQRIINAIDEFKELVEKDEIGICIIMYNYSSIWSGDQFALKGWIDHISEVMKIRLLAGSAPGKSSIWQPEDGGKGNKR